MWARSESHSEKGIKTSPRLLHDVDVQWKCIAGVGRCGVMISGGFHRRWLIRAVYEREQMEPDFEVLILVLFLVLVFILTLILIVRVGGRRMRGRGNPDR